MNRMNFGAAVMLASVMALGIPAITIADEVKRYNLNELIQKALETSPVLQASRSQALASEGGYRQAKSYDNPEIGFETENVGGTGPYKGYKSAETTLGVSQKILTGGKYAARIKAADQNVRLNYSQADIVRLDLVKNVKIAYANLVAAEKNLKIAGQQKQIAEKSLANVKRRVEAAASPLYQRNKSEVLLSTATIELQRAQKEHLDAANALSSVLGVAGQDYEIDDADFADMSSPEISEAELDIADIIPDAAVLRASETQARYNYEIERSNAIPDPTIGMGYRNFKDSDDQAFVASVSLPIPVFDQNRGNIIKAQNEVNQIGQQNKARLIELKNQLINSYRQMKLSLSQVNELEKRVIPAAESSFRQTQTGYDKGRFPYLEVLDAQRTLFDAKFSLNNAIREYHIARAEVERLLPAEETRTSNNEVPNE